VHSTGEIGMVRIVYETSIAAGIRRIEAIPGEMVENVLDEFQDFANSAKEFLNNAPDLREAIRKIVEENADLKKRVETFAMQYIAELSEQLLAQVVEKDGIKIVKHITNIPTEQAKNLAFQLRNRQNEKLKVVIGSVFDGKPSLTILLSDDLVSAGENAVMLIRQAAKHIQGGGGGQPFFAQAGGKNAAGIEEAVEKATLTINN
jgi:alanyl-tRNA synthetase